MMMRGLLADRFQLVVHKDSHSLAGFALTVGKSGPPKLKEAAVPIAIPQIASVMP